MKHALAAALTLLLASCAGKPPPEPVIKTQIVNLPVAVHCKPDIGPDPQYPDTADALAKAPDLFTRVKLLVAGRLLRIQRETELLAAVHGCE